VAPVGSTGTGHVVSFVGVVRGGVPWFGGGAGGTVFGICATNEKAWGRECGHVAGGGGGMDSLGLSSGVFVGVGSQTSKCGGAGGGGTLGLARGGGGAVATPIRHHLR